MSFVALGLSMVGMITMTSIMSPGQCMGNSVRLILPRTVCSVVEIVVKISGEGSMKKFWEMFEQAIAKFRREDFCWRCGNVGWWEEQIDGVKKRRVICPNPIHLGKEFADANPEADS